MRVADLQGDELLAREGGFFGDCCFLDRGSVADADEAQDGGVAFGDTEDVVLEICAYGACFRFFSSCSITCPTQMNLKRWTHPTSPSVAYLLYREC